MSQKEKKAYFLPEWSNILLKKEEKKRKKKLDTSQKVNDGKYRKESGSHLFRSKNSFLDFYEDWQGLKREGGGHLRVKCIQISLPSLPPSFSFIRLDGGEEGRKRRSRILQSCIRTVRYVMCVVCSSTVHGSRSTAHLRFKHIVQECTVPRVNMRSKRFVFMPLRQEMPGHKCIKLQ